MYTFIIYNVIYMTTTVRVNETTVEMLVELKEKMKVRSLEEVIRNLITTQKKKISLFGTSPPLPKWDEHEDRARFRE